MAVKKILIDVLNNFLEPIRKKRRYYEENPELIEKILYKGNENTREVTRETLKLVNRAMNYYYDNIFKKY